MLQEIDNKTQSTSYITKNFNVSKIQTDTASMRAK